MKKRILEAAIGLAVSPLWADETETIGDYTWTFTTNDVAVGVIRLPRRRRGTRIPRQATPGRFRPATNGSPCDSGAVAQL